MGLVERLEAEYLPRLRSLEAELRARHPHLEFATRSWPTGRLTSYQGHGISLECVFRAAVHEPDTVALSIDVCHLDRIPRIMADVCWGHPSGTVEASLEGREAWTSTADWPEASEETLNRLALTFPRLADAFSQAVRRGKSPSQI